MSGPIALGGPLLQYLTQSLAARSIGRRTPAKRSSGASIEALDKALDQRVAEVGSGRKTPDYTIKQVTPNDDFNPFTFMFDGKKVNPNYFAGQGYNPATKQETIYINPNNDAAYLAHEMGHIATKQTDVGRFVREARNYLADPKNAKLTAALGMSAFGLGGAAAALNPGDDDLATSIAMTTVPLVPTLIDEALATKNGLAIMNRAGMPATMGQRGRLAGGYLSYMLPAIVGGGTANFLGNLIDENE